MSLYRLATGYCLHNISAGALPLSFGDGFTGKGVKIGLNDLGWMIDNQCDINTDHGCIQLRITWYLAGFTCLINLMGLLTKGISSVFFSGYEAFSAIVPLARAGCAVSVIFKSLWSNTLKRLQSSLRLFHLNLNSTTPWSETTTSGSAGTM